MINKKILICSIVAMLAAACVWLLYSHHVSFSVNCYYPTRSLDEAVKIERNSEGEIVTMWRKGKKE